MRGERSPGFSVVAQQITEHLNAARATHHLPPLVLHADLCRFAEQRARETAAQGSLENGAADSHSGSIQALRALGYQPHLISEVYAQVRGTPFEVVAGWQTQGDHTWGEVLRPEWRDLGIGVASLASQPLYALVFSQPQADYFAAETAALGDLVAVRKELLAQVNALRKERRASALRASRLLDQAAQRYAELMLRTGHYGHLGPDGGTALDRAVRDGYEPLVVGENLAKGQTRVEDVMTGWIESPAHLRNLLSPEFSEAGFGIAVGTSPAGPDVVWVQLFGSRR